MSDARRLVRLYYWFQLTITLMLWQPIFFQYQQLMGLSDQQNLDTQSVYYLSFFLLEIPTGFLADRLGYLGCVRVGAALHVLTHAIPVAWTTFHGFLAHWILLALSRSLISGAASAYLYNELEARGQVELYKEAEGRARAWSLAAKVLGFLGTDLMTRSSMALPYIGSAFSAVVATFVALLFPRPTRPPATKTSEKPQLRVVGQLLVRDPLLQLVILQGIAIFTLTRIVQVNMFQPLLAARGFAATSFGTILAANTLFEALGSANPKLFRRYCSDLAAVFWLTAGLALCSWALAHSGHWGCFWWLNVFSLLTGFAFPIQRQVMNEHIPDSRYRASLLSAESLVDRAVCAWVAHRLGSALQAGEMGLFLNLSAGASLGACLLLAPLYAFWKGRRTAPSACGDSDGGEPAPLLATTPADTEEQG